MLKYRVTNVTGKDGRPGRPKFIIEAGVLLQPGESIPVNRLGPGTKEDPDLDIEQGEFHRVAAEVVKKPAVDDDDDIPPRKTKEEAGPARLIDGKRKSKVVPLIAEPTVPPALAARATPAPLPPPGDDPANDDAPLSRDELDEEVLSAKPEPSGPAGFVDVPPPSAAD